MNPLASAAHRVAAAYRLRRCGRRVGSRAWARRMLDAAQPNCPARATADGRLSLLDLGLTIGPDHTFALEAYGHLWELKACGFSLAAVASGEIEIRGQGVTMRLNSVEELFIAREIFCDRIYDVQPEGDALVIDVGMNIGTASLFFAALFPDSRVEAFEPFPATLQRAEDQFALNASLSSRVCRHGFGLWEKDEEREVEFDPHHKGSTGLWGRQRDLDAAAGGEPNRQTIHVRDAAAVLRPLLAANRRGPIILKIDCEGAEYGVMRRLATAGLIERFDVILMEWHRAQSDHDPRELRTLLGRSGFRCLCHDYLHRPFGMLYAFRIPGAIVAAEAP